MFTKRAFVKPFNTHQEEQSYSKQLPLICDKVCLISQGSFCLFQIRGNAQNVLPNMDWYIQERRMSPNKVPQY